MRHHTLSALVTFAGLTGGASAQCDWLVQHVPDFDQRRATTPTIPGLPGDGSMYCVPTSRLDWCGYIANHGFPAVLDGPRKWSNNANYDFITARDLFMGSLMGTDAVHGSNVQGGLNGARAYLDLFAPGRFDVTHVAASGSWGPTPTDMTVSHTLGGLVCAGYGRYDEAPAGFYTRHGGHAMTLVGMQNLCTGAPRLIYRDPADDTPANTTQSGFINTDPLLVQPITGHFRNGDTQAYNAQTIYLYSTLTGHLCFLDGYSVIWPKHGLTTGSNTDLPETIQVLRPIRLTGSLLPAVQSFSTPTGGAVRDLAMNARLTQYFYITGPVGSTPAELFRLDPTTGISTQITGFANPTRLISGRQGQFYILDSGNILELFPDLPPGAAGPPATASQGIDAMVFDDFTDQIIGVDGATRTLYIWNANFVGGFASAALPPPCINGRISLAIGPADAALWLCSHNCDAIYKITGNPQSGFTIADTITLAAGSGPTGLNIGSDGHVFFSSNGFLREMEKNASNLWIDSPKSGFAGLPAGATFYLSRTRSNFDPTMSGPGYYDLPDPEIIHGTPDCYANCDGSTAAPVLNVNDFACFLNQFASGDPEANCDDSTTPPVLNVNDFACFLNRFAAGCP